MSFLKKAFGKKLQFSQRVLDPAILYMNLLKDKEVPNLKECLKRAGIEKEVAHDALEDALDVIRLLRKKY